MKVKSLLLMAFAASTTFVACDKNESEPGVTNSVPKSVTIKLANIAAVETRSSGGDVISSGDDITLNSYQIFFSDGTTLYKAKNAQGVEDSSVDYYIDENDIAGDADAMPTELSFHFLPAEVNKVIVIGNHEEITNVTTEAALNIALGIADEQDAEDLTLYAEGALVSKNPPHTDGNPLYEVGYSVELSPAPRIARLYVKSFSCTFSSTPLYNSLVLKDLALNNYYKSSTLKSNTVSNLENTVLTAENVWNWLADKLDNHDDFCDELNITLTSTNNSTTTNLHYHIFPGVAPQLVLQAEGDSSPLYLPTVRFIDKGTNAEVVWEAGTIYEMDFAFLDTDFSQPDKCVDIKVTAKKWQLKPVKPEFK